MRILIDINHPAHVHFFRHPMALLRERGHEVVVTSRDKEVALPLLEALGIEHRALSAHRGGGALALLRELVQRDRALVRIARAERIERMAAIGGTFVAHAGALLRIPALVFYDTENARLQNAITYPLAARVHVPRCYRGWLPRRHARYAGYHELAYLHPSRFTPDREVARANGLADDRPTFLVRTVAWTANHDLGERGWSAALLRAVVSHLAAAGRVLVSAEGALPRDVEPYRYRGAPEALHHVMAFCRLYVGESATMASECAVLGVPAIYAAHTGRGYTDEQELRYGLVRNVRELTWAAMREAIEAMLGAPQGHWHEARARLLADTIDVARYVADAIERYPELPRGAP
ncbi:DUF354 domain-containing protein [Inmirania thermothiophila]|uniref:DUF354 domain-containing protein n=1 Tax=Inmirania thermothiophila TaxID=1750597 RepID=A0A3N1XST3_9GAMM|nr:DUF354 domain-containing protein [Inmirania thermothiophila]ROR29703.1 hypothetical protein EDC57_2375 [Inmirania thermothiophila]